MGKKRGNKRNANPITLGSTDGATGGKAPANKEQEKKEEVPSKSDVSDKQSEEVEPDKVENISGAEGEQGLRPSIVICSTFLKLLISLMNGATQK